MTGSGSAGVFAKRIPARPPALLMRDNVVLFAILVIASSAPQRGALGQDTRPGTDTRPVDEFIYRIPEEGITLEQLAKDAEVASQRTFILSDKSPLRGKIIRLAGEARVPRDQAFSLFQALFVTQGYALKPLGDASGRILVVESIDTATDLKQRATFVSEEEVDRYRNEVGTVVMTFFPLRHVKLQNVRAALGQILASKSVETTLDVESANALIVIGFAPTVYAMKQIIRVMDVPQKETELEFALIPLENAVAEELEPILTDLLASSPVITQPGNAQQGLSADKPPARIVAEPRLGGFAVYAVPSDIAEIRRLVAALDLAAGEVPQNLRLYWLKHTNADDVADVLKEIYGLAEGGGAGGATRAPAGSGGKEAGGGGGSAALADVRIVAEPLNNVLIIRASRTQYDALLPVIRDLDRARAQVIIRSAIAEMTADQLKRIGTEIAALDGGNGRYHPGAITGFGLSALSLDPAPGGAAPAGDTNLTRLPFFPGNTPGNSGGVFGIFNDSLNVPLLVNLMQTGRHGNLISAPLVIATDNTQSTIESGRSVPSQTFSTTPQGDQTGFGGYQEAKIALTISPHISNDSYVRLEVEILVERFLPSTDTRPEIPPDKTSRKLVGSVTLRDGDTVLIGGLVLDQDSFDQAGVPPFADAALLGPLFRLRGTSCERTAIYFFLTPTILYDFAGHEAVSYEKKLEVDKLMGPVRLIDPNFRPIRLDHPWIGIEGIECSGNLDLPRYVPVVPLKDCSGNLEK